ncbi:MAG TPA: DUF1127 domain-containing protein [Geminicoccaceae bacterium]|nr:DUF1127 domain-containing protein [Geminicoccaceae bacterium]
MKSGDCTDTIRAPAHRPLTAHAVALVWFAGRQLEWWLGQGCEAALTWAERARQRRQLAELNDYMLHDIGLTRADVAGETGKPFWRP